MRAEHAHVDFAHRIAQFSGRRRDFVRPDAATY
jgi:hypothetical protein